MISQGKCRPTSPGLHAFLISFAVVGLHDCGDVDIHTLIESSEQQQQQHTTHNTQHTTHITQHTTHNTQHTTHNNDTIWGGSVSTGEEPPLHSGELKHALSQAGGLTQSQLSRPMSSGHHISMEHRLRRKQLNSDTNASNKKIFERNTGKKKRRNFFF